MAHDHLHITTHTNITANRSTHIKNTEVHLNTTEEEKAHSSDCRLKIDFNSLTWKNKMTQDLFTNIDTIKTDFIKINSLRVETMKTAANMSLFLIYCCYILY